MEGRQEFLLKLYDQLYNSINRYYTIAWQSVTGIVGFLGLAGLTEKGIVHRDVACSFAVIISGWMAGLALDSAYWMNRNLAMIRNIEQQFLVGEDVYAIHHYWTTHGRYNIGVFFIIQMVLAGAFCGLFILSHFIGSVAPSLRFSIRLADLDVLKALPYVILPATVGLLILMYRHQQEQYQDFVRQSPGVIATVDEGDEKEG